MIDIPVKCTRCRHACMESEWIDVPMKKHADCSEKTCPRCGCKSYYDCRPEVAWCWASGLIEIGDTVPPSSPNGGGAIEIARGPRYALRGFLSAIARHGKGASTGALLVPGVPEGKSQRDKHDALAAWLAWAGGRKRFRDGVVLTGEVPA